MNLSAPTMIVFIISFVLAVVGLLAGLAILPGLPVSAFWIMAIAWAVLAVGNLMTGL